MLTRPCHSSDLIFFFSKNRALITSSKYLCPQTSSSPVSLSQSLEVPVLPVALIGAHEAMPKGSSWPRWGRPPVVVALGEPMRHRPNESVPSFNERIQATVRSLYAQNRPLIDDPDAA